MSFVEQLRVLTNENKMANNAQPSMMDAIRRACIESAKNGVDNVALTTNTQSDEIETCLSTLGVAWVYVKKNCQHPPPAPHIATCGEIIGYHLHW